MHTLPKLQYNYQSLTPCIDPKTMMVHFTKHHAGYVKKLNETLKKYPNLQELSVEELLRRIDRVPARAKTAIINFGGGHANHSLFWSVLAPNGKDKFPKDMPAGFKELGGYENFKKVFTQAAMSRFGSGWAWLVVNSEGKLKIYSTPNQDSPLMVGDTPILALDMWEHSYYLKYQNRKEAYIKAFWHIVDWNRVTDLYEDAIANLNT